jgi:hypothetical protein
MRRLITLFVSGFIFTALSFGFAHEGHQAIGEIARSHLSEMARAAVVQILGTDDLASVAAWLDDVRSAGRNRGSMKGDEAARDFNERFPKSSSWQFVNFPVGSGQYDSSSVFATENDVVHAIGLAVSTLEGASTGLTRVEALKVLIHCVGDIHQPLHCISGYYDLSSPSTPRLLSPSEATLGSVSDAGGNAIFFTKAQNLHTLFDSLLLQRVVKGSDYRQLAAAIEERERRASHQTSSGDYHLWPELWASESIQMGTDAYSGIEFGPAETSPGPGRSSRLHRIPVTLPAGYEKTWADALAVRIGDAGLRLAELLNSIRWPQK